MSIYAGPETIKAVVDISNVQWTVDLVRVAADGDAARPWRIDMPGERFDGLADGQQRPPGPCLMSDERPATPATYGTVHPQDDKSQAQTPPSNPLTDAERAELAVAFADYRSRMGDPDPSSTEPGPADRLAAATERASEMNATAPPWFLVEDSDGAPFPQEAQDVIWRITEAIRLTQEHVGLPAAPGWSWYDALAQYRPDLDLENLAGPRRET